MAAVEHPATSMNGNINFPFREDENNDDAFESGNLQDEVCIFVLVYFHGFPSSQCAETSPWMMCLFVNKSPKCLSSKAAKSPQRKMSYAWQEMMQNSQKRVHYCLQVVEKETIWQMFADKHACTFSRTFCLKCLFSPLQVSHHFTSSVLRDMDVPGMLFNNVDSRLIFSLPLVNYAKQPMWSSTFSRLRCSSLAEFDNNDLCINIYQLCPFQRSISGFFARGEG